MEHTQAQDIEGNLIDNVADDGNGNFPASRNDGNAMKLQLDRILQLSNQESNKLKKHTTRKVIVCNSELETLEQNKLKYLRVELECEKAVRRAKNAPTKINNEKYALIIEHREFSATGNNVELERIESALIDCNERLSKCDDRIVIANENLATAKTIIRDWDSKIAKRIALDNSAIQSSTDRLASLGITA